MYAYKLTLCARRSSAVGIILLAICVAASYAERLHAQEAKTVYAAKEQPQRSFLARIYDRFFGSSQEENDIFPVPDGIPYTLTFNLPSNNAAAELEKVSDLERLKNQLPSGSMGLIARAHADRERLISALEALGYYNGDINITIAGASLEHADISKQIEIAQRTGPVPVKIKIQPGKRYVFDHFSLIDANTHQLLPPPDWEKLGLKARAPALSSAVLSAEGALVNYYREQGYARARVANRRATVDHSRLTMDLVLQIDTGPKVHFGPVKVTGTEHLDPHFIIDRVPFKEGDVFSPALISNLRRDLSSHDALGSIRIVEADHLISNDELPIEIKISERLPHFVGFGAKYSTTEGMAANAYWGHRNLFGGAEKLRLEAQMSGADIKTINGKDRAKWYDKVGYKIGASFFKPGIFTVKDDFLAEVTGLRELTKTYTRQGMLGSLGIKRTFSDEFWAQLGVSVERAKYTAPSNLSYTKRGWYTLIGMPLQMSYDNTGDRLNPIQGIKISGKVIPYSSFLGSKVNMTKVDASISGYLPIDDKARYVVAGRVRFGSILGVGLENIPPPHRFFAGGGGSVRGYNYQSLGPQDSAGNVVGGRSLFEGSAEIRAKMTDTIGIVAFADAGMSFRSSTPKFDENLRYSAGLGLRYYTSIGPIRFDIARGLNRKKGDPPYGLYISLGQAF